MLFSGCVYICFGEIRHCLHADNFLERSPWHFSLSIFLFLFFQNKYLHPLLLGLFPLFKINAKLKVFKVFGIGKLLEKAHIKSLRNREVDVYIYIEGVEYKYMCVGEQQIRLGWREWKLSRDGFGCNKQNLPSCLKKKKKKSTNIKRGIGFRDPQT